MDSSVSPKEEIWFLLVCHHISTGLYQPCVNARLHLSYRSDNCYRILFCER